MISAILRMEKCKDKHHRNMRYDSEWLIEDQMKTFWFPKFLDHLKKGLIPLPSNKSKNNKKRLEGLPPQLVGYLFE